MVKRVTPSRRIKKRLEHARYSRITPAEKSFAAVWWLAGWHARGRAERITKAERAVIEAAVKLMKRSVPGNVIRLQRAVANLERARRKA